MEPTTPDGGGVAPATVPQDPPAVSLGEAGAPVLRPKTAPLSTPPSQQQPTEEPAPAEPNPAEEPQEPQQPAPTQPEEQPTEPAPAGDDLASWAQSQGIDLENPTPEQTAMLAKRLRDTQAKMHEATQAAKTPSIEPPEMQDLTGNEAIDVIIERQNGLEARQYVRDWYNAHPEAREHHAEMIEISKQRPWLTNMDDVYAHLQANPDFQAKLKRDGGREALTNLAQKQSARPPQASATTSVPASSDKITPDNVDAVVAAHMGDAKWYSAHKSEIDRAMAGVR